MSNLIVFVLIVLLTITTSLAQTSKTKQSIEIATVCDVITNRSFYNTKVIAVIGGWSATDEGVWLADDCKNEIKTGDYVWENSVWLEYAPSSITALSGKMKLDKSAVNKKIAEMKSRMKPTNEKIQWVVVYGRVEAQEELQTAYAGDGKSLYPAGYGHLNGAPAQVVYQQKDLKHLPNR
ncbi:MAG TPA: hypothetical protein VF540_11920 [Segetibacter sp.]|jgi:hypothetical protein